MKILSLRSEYLGASNNCALTERHTLILNAYLKLNSELASFFGSNADGLLDLADKDFAVSNFPGLRGFNDHRDRLFNQMIAQNHFQLGSSRVDLQACKLEYSIVSPK